MACSAGACRRVLVLPFSITRAYCVTVTLKHQGVARCVERQGRALVSPLCHTQHTCARDGLPHHLPSPCQHLYTSFVPFMAQLNPCSPRLPPWPSRTGPGLRCGHPCTIPCTRSAPGCGAAVRPSTWAVHRSTPRPSGARSVPRPTWYDLGSLRRWLCVVSCEG